MTEKLSIFVNLIGHTSKVTENLSICRGNKLYLKSDGKPYYMQEKKVIPKKWQKTIVYAREKSYT